MQSILEDALSPFRYLDMGAIYQNYGQFIDGIIFFSIFLGLSRFAFSKRFPGRSGNLVSIAFSFALTIALLVMEATFNFSIKSFGALAIGVIFLLTGFFMMTLGRAVGMGGVTSFCLTYCLVYISIASVIPGVFDYIATRTPWLNGLLGIIFLISLFKTLAAIFTFVFRRKGQSISEPKIATAEQDSEKDISLENTEIKAIKELRHKLVTIDDIMDALNHIESIIRQNPALTPDQVASIKRYLSEIGTKETVFKKAYYDMERRFRLLGRIDSERFERLQSELANAPDNRKRIKEAELDIEKRKIEHEKNILNLKTRTDNHIAGFNEQVNMAIQRLNESPESAISILGQSRQTLLQMKHQIDMMRQLERELQDLHKTQRELFKGDNKKKR